MSKLPSILIPEILSSEIVYHGFFDVQQDLLKLPHGPKQHYTSLRLGVHAAIVLCETEGGKLLLLKEYRHPTKRWMLGCPGGRMNSGESPIEAAKRELLEETGYVAEEYILMGTIYPFPALTDQKIHYILGKKGKLIQPTTHEPFELIEPCLKTPDEIHQELLSGTPVDGILCTALHLRSILS